MPSLNVEWCTLPCRPALTDRLRGLNAAKLCIQRVVVVPAGRVQGRRSWTQSRGKQNQCGMFRESRPGRIAEYSAVRQNHPSSWCTVSRQESAHLMPEGSHSRGLRAWPSGPASTRGHGREHRRTLSTDCGLGSQRRSFIVPIVVPASITV